MRASAVQIAVGCAVSCCALLFLMRRRRSVMLGTNDEQEQQLVMEVAARVAAEYRTFVQVSAPCRESSDGP